MKNKVYYFLIVIAVIFPISVNANIVCNDGTISPSCVDCHRGCCSRHGGCGGGVAIQKTTKRVTKTTSRKTTTSRRTTTSSRITTTESTTSSIKTTITTKNKYILITEKNDEKKSDLENEETPVALLAILAIVGTVYAVVASKKKKQ